MFLGFILSVATVAMSYRSENTVSAAWLPFVLPPLLLVIPLTDGLFVTTSRLRRGQAPWRAGLDHLSHRLVDRGMNRPEAVRRLLLMGSLGILVAITLRWMTSR